MGSKLPGPSEPGPFHLRAGGRDRHKVILALCLANFLDCLDPGPPWPSLVERGHTPIGLHGVSSGIDAKLQSQIC